ncbi:MAG: hypothetical protein JOZ61_10995 [Verrucomicrobia bacterium]|nr:hypothetical protein [Verrucomicrobiota bacterium]
MDKLQAYEFVALICPGAFTIYGLSKIFPQAATIFSDDKLSFGEFGLLLVLAFVAGHLVQSLGNLIEKAYWSLWGGKPTDWLRTGKHDVISPKQKARIPPTIKRLLNIDCPEDFKLSRKDWSSLTSQIYAAVRKSGQAARIDVFVGAYDLLRGIAASVVLLAVTAVLVKGQANLPGGISFYGLSLVLLVLALYRMHRFGFHYANELFVQFLTIELEIKDKPEIAD